jgi:hypothetical protein
MLAQHPHASGLPFTRAERAALEQAAMGAAEAAEPLGVRMEPVALGATGALALGVMAAPEITDLAAAAAVAAQTMEALVAAEQNGQQPVQAVVAAAVAITGLAARPAIMAAEAAVAAAATLVRRAFCNSPIAFPIRKPARC